MKKTLSLLLALAMIFSLAACGQSKGNQSGESAATPATTEKPVPTESAESAAAMVNPVTTVANYQALLSAQPTIRLNDAPVGSENVVYSYINNIPVISQIQFRYNGADYTYRASFGADSSDISGVYSVLSNVVAARYEPENKAGGPYTIRYDESSGEAVANWNTALSGCRYSLYTDSAYKSSGSEYQALLGALYNCTPDARSAEGTVNSVQGNTLVLTLEDGNNAVLDCTNVPKLTLQPRDIVSFSYLGDLRSTAYLISALKIGEEEEDTTFSGTLIKINGAMIYVLTGDNNVFAFSTKGARVTGQSTILTENSSVIIHYTGDLYNEPTAVVIEVTNAAPVTPVPTVAPTNRTTSGNVTSVAGNYVTVNGICFDVTNKIISGTPTVGYGAVIDFVDYGNSVFKVSAASFEVPQPIQSYSTSGIVTSVFKANANDWYFTVNGLYIHLNTRGCGGDGSALAEGAWVYVEYEVRSGLNEATFVTVTPPEPTPTPAPESIEFNGTVATVEMHFGSLIFTLASGARYHVGMSDVTGVPKEGCNAVGSAYQRPDGYDWYCDWVYFEESGS